MPELEITYCDAGCLTRYETDDRELDLFTSHQEAQGNTVTPDGCQGICDISKGMELPVDAVTNFTARKGRMPARFAIATVSGEDVSRVIVELPNRKNRT